MIAESAGASLREPPAPRRPRVLLPRLPRAPPSSSLLSLRVFVWDSQGLLLLPAASRARTRAPLRALRVTPAPARSLWGEGD